MAAGQLLCSPSYNINNIGSSVAMEMQPRKKKKHELFLLSNIKLNLLHVFLHHSHNAVHSVHKKCT